MKKILLAAFMVASMSMLTVSCEKDPKPTPTPPKVEVPKVEDPKVEEPETDLKLTDGFAGVFEAEGNELATKFVRVLYVAEGDEKNEGDDSMEQVIFDSKDKDGKDIKVYRFQIVCKNTGYDVLQKEQSKSSDYKMKNNTGGFKIFIEVPLKDGKADLANAVIGNLGYTFTGDNKTKTVVKLEDIDGDIKFNLKKLDIPADSKIGKPGDAGLFYELGHITLDFNVKLKSGDFKGLIDSEISVLHVRGKSKADKAVTIDPEMVKKNAK